MGEEVFDRNGHYLGEIRENNRLITALHKQTKLGSSFIADASRVRLIPSAEYVGYAVDTGYKDFPSPDAAVTVTVAQPALCYGFDPVAAKSSRIFAWRSRTPNGLTM